MKKKVLISNENFLIIIIIVISFCLIVMLAEVVSAAKKISSWEKEFQWAESLTNESDNGERVNIYQIHISKNSKDQILYCQGKYQFASIWINGSFAGEYPGNRNVSENLGLWEAMIPLPENDVTVRFEVISPYRSYEVMGLKTSSVNTFVLSGFPG